jgi:hypothetical protein
MSAVLPLQIPIVAATRTEIWQADALAGDEMAQYSGEDRGQKACGITRNCTEAGLLSLLARKGEQHGSIIAHHCRVSSHARALCFVGQNKALARVPSISRFVNQCIQD